MIKASEALRTSFLYNHFISNKHKWNNCFIKYNQEILLGLADFTLQERPEDYLMVAIFRAWYNSSHSVHYTIIQFLIIVDIL